MNYKSISYSLGLFCFPISFLSFVNILYSSYFDYFLSVQSYAITLFVSLFLGIVLYFFGKNIEKKINFYEQIILIILVYFTISCLIAIPYYLSNYQITFTNSIFEAFSGTTGTGFSIFDNIKYLDPTLILWRSSSQWIGGLYFLIFLIQFFSNSQFNYKLNHLTTMGDIRNTKLDTKKIILNIFIIYVFLSIIIFILFNISQIRLFDSLNLTMTIVSNGGFLSSNFLEQIIKTNIQQLMLIIALFISTLNIFFIYNLFFKKNILVENHEDFGIILIIIFFSFLLLLMVENTNIFEIIANVLTSLSTSGISLSKNSNNLSLYYLFLTIIGGSIISNSSGIKFLRIYILLKSSIVEIFKLVKPNNIENKNILFSTNKINEDSVKLAFLIFISFFISLFILSGILLFDNINFENSFKLSILTLTNTTNSNIYGLDSVEFKNLLTSSKLALIIFMIIGKIELISIFLLIKKMLFKN